MTLNYDPDADAQPNEVWDTTFLVGQEAVKIEEELTIYSQIEMYQHKYRSTSCHILECT